MKESRAQKIKYAAAGLLAGAANGFFGAGGGIFIIPLYTRWAKLDEKRAYASSVAAILPICAVSAAVYLLRGGVEPGEALPYLLGGVIGGAVGGRMFKKIPPRLLRRAFALLLICGGVRSLIIGQLRNSLREFQDAFGVPRAESAKPPIETQL